MGALHLYLVRHGESVDNVANLYAGSRDAPLTSHGVLQARRLGAHLVTRTTSASAGITHIFTSNLQRAYRTAEAVRDALSSPDVASNARRLLEVVRLPELREKHFGSGEGQRFGVRPVGNRHIGAEDHDAMRVRAERFIDEYLVPIFACIDAEDGTTESVVIVAHGIILGVLARLLQSVSSFASPVSAPREQLQLSWSNTGFVEMRVELVEKQPVLSKSAAPAVRWPGLSLRIVRVNCTDHLQGLKKTRGGIGSATFDEKQKTLNAFFVPNPKKRKYGDKT
ncbi:putative phosphatase [Colletotrichum chlorophyti]|uniref:Putative phosphatase n=1 Tax=Colletotrichum chlorophyti TaxID=708187 RepID=A0A1Q8RYT0_9PEZI|nr:putative phosphatase [Colletotrichum chlorophyti]